MQDLAEQRARRDLKRIRQYLDEENYAAAVAAAEASILRFPRLPAARYWAAMVHLAQGRQRQAIERLREAIGLDGERPAYYAALARAQLAYGDVHPAIASAMRGVALNPLSVAILDGLAQVLREGGAHEQALLLIDRALEQRPRDPELLLSRSFLLRSLGRDDEALDVLQRVIQVAPAHGRAHWSLSRVEDSDAAGHLAALLPLASSVDGGSADAPWIDYALYHRLESLGRHDEAVAALQCGAARQRRRIPFDASGNARIFALMKSHLLAWEKATDKVHAAAAGAGDPVPIFILGMPRSGTTLVERLLGNHEAVVQGGESHEFATCVQHVLDAQHHSFLDEPLARRLGELDWPALAALYRTRLRERFGSVPFVTEKLPANYIYAAAIARALPEARLVRVLREPMDNCFSLFRQMYSGVNPFSFDQAELAQHYVAYEEWMRQVAAVLPDRLLTIRYEQLVSAPVLVGRALYRFCGLEWNDDFADPTHVNRPVALPGTVRVDEPLHTRFVGRWRRYEAALQPLQRLLAAAGLVQRSA